MSFTICAMMKVVSVNTRIQGTDDLADDISIKGVVKPDVAANALGLNTIAFQRLCWDSDGNPTGSVELIRSTKLEDCNVRISRPTAKKANTVLDRDEASLKDITVRPTNGGMAAITFKIQTLCSETESGKVHGCMKKDVALEIDDEEFFADFNINRFEHYTPDLPGTEDGAAAE